ncbi:hypothetical protein MRX96_023349 [Rhipicephalus microplus]
MAATALRGYNPTTLPWKEISTPVPENSIPPTDIVDEGLFTVVALRKRRQQSKATQGSATNKAASANIPPEKKISRATWRSTAMPRIAAEVFTIVLKPRVMHAGGHHGSRGAPKQRSTPKTCGVVPGGRQPGATNQATKNPATGGTSQQAPSPPKTPSQQTSSKTPDQGAPVLQSGDVSPLTDSGTYKRSNKKTASQFSHAISLAETSEDFELPLAQGAEIVVDSLPVTQNSQYGDSS